jgi:hypothetical protein
MNTVLRKRRAVTRTCKIPSHRLPVINRLDLAAPPLDRWISDRIHSSSFLSEPLAAVPAIARTGGQKRSRRRRPRWQASFPFGGAVPGPPLVETQESWFLFQLFKPIPLLVVTEFDACKLFINERPRAML